MVDSGAAIVRDLNRGNLHLVNCRVDVEIKGKEKEVCSANLIGRACGVQVYLYPPFANTDADDIVLEQIELNRTPFRPGTAPPDQNTLGLRSYGYSWEFGRRTNALRIDTIPDREVVFRPDPRTRKPQGRVVKQTPQADGDG